MKNLHDPTSNLSIKKKGNLLGGFKIDWEKSNTVIKEDFKQNKKGENNKIKFSSAVEYQIGLFRKPEPMIGTLFVPMFILTFLQGLVFFSEGAQVDKLAIVATILLAILSY